MYATYESKKSQQRASLIRLGLGLWAAVGAALVVMAVVAPASTNLNVQTQSQVASRVAPAAFNNKIAGAAAAASVAMAEAPAAMAVVDDRIRKLVQDMAETMYEAPGIGLAATQVDVHERVITIDVSESRDALMVFINPEIVWASDNRKVWEEGCLSVREVYDRVERPDRVKVRALNERGETFEIEADDLLAVCIQHEIDHLDGKVFVEYLSPLKINRIKSKLQKRVRSRM